MPSERQGRYYYRVSELIAECEEQIFHANNQMKHLQMTGETYIKGGINFESIRGTWVHNIVENQIRNFMDMDEIDQKWTKREQEMFDYYNDPKNRVVNKLFENQVASSVTNFENWWNFYQPEDCIPEQRILFEVPSLSYPVKGTVDFIGSIEQRKLDYAVTGRLGNKTDRKMSVIDWKSGKSGKPMQITAYLYGLQQNADMWQDITEEYDVYTHKAKNNKIDIYGAMCFLGGDHYDFKSIKYSPNAFLKKCAKHESALRNPVNVNSGNFQTSAYVCKYCPFSHKCSILGEELVNITIS